MLDLIAHGETDYFLPEDGAAAEARFLALLNSPGETWLAAYAVTLAPLFAAILAADAAGVVLHMLLDHSQAIGTIEAAALKAFVPQLKHSDVTITTAGCGSACADQIWHIKSMVVLAEPLEPWVWEGSVNFSAGGWLQGNTARVFRSRAYAEKMIEQFSVHREWALQNESQFQIQGVTDGPALGQNTEAHGGGVAGAGGLVQQ